jgi:hypothetical protein
MKEYTFDANITAIHSRDGETIMYAEGVIKYGLTGLETEGHVKFVLIAEANGHRGIKVNEIAVSVAGAPATRIIEKAAFMRTRDAYEPIITRGQWLWDHLEKVHTAIYGPSK